MKRKTEFRRTAAAKACLLGILLVCGAAFGSGFLPGQKASAAPYHAPAIVASANDKCNKGGFFGLEPWYHFMPDSEIGVPAKTVNGKVVLPADNCAIKCFNIFFQSQGNDCNETRSDVPGVVLAVIDDLLQIAGLVAVAFIIIGAFQFVASRGNPDKTAQAQSAVINALTGLAVTLVAVAFVSFIGSKLN
jgi:hypothetical protein